MRGSGETGAVLGEDGKRSGEGLRMRAARDEERHDEGGCYD